MSRSEARSYNFNLNNFRLGKVHMSTAKQFSYTITCREAGRDAIINKDNTENADKLVPIVPDRSSGHVNVFCV
jgi:hypothetical protein